MGAYSLWWQQNLGQRRYVIHLNVLNLKNRNENRKVLPYFCWDYQVIARSIYSNTCILSDFVEFHEGICFGDKQFHQENFGAVHHPQWSKWGGDRVKERTRRTDSRGCTWSQGDTDQNPQSILCICSGVWNFLVQNYLIT